MLTKFLLLEGAVIALMVGTFLHQQLPATEVTVGKATYVIKEVADTVPTLPTLPAPKSEVLQRPAVASELLFPVAGHGPDAVISVFGDRRGASRIHQGIDIKAPRGTAVVAVTDGFVERIKEGGSGGRQVYLRDAKGRLFYYAHLDDWSVQAFDAVVAGTPLGTVGDTGNAKGTTPHLHFEVLTGKDRTAIDPLRYWLRP